MSSADKNNLCESCKRLIELYGTNEFAVPWRCTCNATPNPVDQVKRVQTEFSTITGNWGKWCRNGICDILDHRCSCKPVYHWYFARRNKKVS
jgi:hypothetical protein